MPHILYLEDEAAVAEMVMRWLRKANYKITHTTSQGEQLYIETVKMLADAQEQYDFVLQDLQLKQNDPDSIYDRRIHEAVKQYKAQVNPRLCWIIISASTSDELIGAAKGYPVDICHNKNDITRTTLLQLLEKCVHIKAAD